MFSVWVDHNTIKSNSVKNLNHGKRFRGEYNFSLRNLLHVSMFLHETFSFSKLFDDKTSLVCT